MPNHVRPERVEVKKPRELPNVPDEEEENTPETPTPAP